MADTKPTLRALTVPSLAALTALAALAGATGCTADPPISDLDDAPMAAGAKPERPATPSAPSTSSGGGAPATGSSGAGSTTPAPSAAPSPQGCIDSVAPGDHTFTCGRIPYTVRVPSACPATGCGIIVDVHGATMSADIEDANTDMRALGTAQGFIVVQPSSFGPLNEWEPYVDDDSVVQFVQLAEKAFAADPKRVHVTGFSAGGAMTFRLLCKHADVFASYAAAAGHACTFAAGDTPSREAPVLYMQGVDDNLESYQDSAIPQRDQIVSGWHMDAGVKVAGDGKFERTRFTSPTGNVFEFLQHHYVAMSFLLGGHCYPGSQDHGGAKGQLMPFACTGNEAFVWGQEVVAFFLAHPAK